MPLPPQELLSLHARRHLELELDAAAERLRPYGTTRRLLATALRGVADRLVPAPSAGPAFVRPTAVDRRTCGDADPRPAA